ncbi:transport and Golgi organization protein 1 homolog isoform X3 [Suricata suricatta]|uniref:transport and Golgi organization protein 1 homolog isoform X3 n=1 Tax=Suricata suricatta TaxID=37032 RepID=UPI0011556376|nr:transport and Golgi organization protein 1 homolog isoform X3 [Suricata suricatta]
MYRGEALEDFTGPDCRFVSFKKGDPVYVYYKLAGRPPEVWAGSVGRIFGYFPKDLIKVVHKYTEEELRVPADETDFVCFDGGRDDFDNYNVEELLGFLELYNSATGEPEKAIEKIQHEDTPPEAVDESDLEPELEPEAVEFNFEESESILSETSQELRGRSGAQKTHPHIHSQADHAQGDQPAFEPFEDVLQDKLKVPESESNKTNNGSQFSSEQEKIDAYKLLKTEMTLDLKTKFGSTADALVSDDETTRLVTSLEDDFDEELDMEYYTVGKEDEEDEESFGELPLLTFTHAGEDVKTPGKSGVQKYPTETGQNSKEKEKAEVTQPPGIKNYDQDLLTTWEDSILFTEGDRRPGVAGGSSDPEEGKEGGDVFKPQLAADSTDLKKAEDGLLILEAPNTSNDRDPEIHFAGHGRNVGESEKGLARAEMGLEGRREGTEAPGATQSSDLGSLPAAEKGKEGSELAFDNKENDVEGAAVHISKEMLHEEKPTERISEGGLEREAEPAAPGGQATGGKTEQDSMGIAPPSRGNQHNASEDGVGEANVVVGGPEPHTVSVEPPHADSKEEWHLKTDSQPRPSPPDEVGLPGAPEEEGSLAGRNLSWPQGEETALAHNGQVDGRVQEGSSGKHLAPQRPAEGTPEVETGVQVDNPEGPGFHPEKTQEAEDDYSPEELLEDENALSAKQAKEKSPGIQGGRLGVSPQAPAGAALGSTNTEAEAQGNKEAASNIVEMEGKSETLGKEADPGAREMGSGAVGKESPLVGQKARRPPEVSDPPDQKMQTPELGEVSENQDSDSFQEDGREEHLQSSRPPGKPGMEGLAEEGREDLQRAVDTGGRGSADGGHEGDLPQGAAHGDPVKDLPVIGSFFKDQQSLERFQKYFDVRELEAMFLEMSLKLKSAQRESLPYNVEKVLDKVFRASESQILSIAEKMLDARVAENRELGTREDHVFEEAAVLDDIQDLIYFVRYKHSALEETAPLAMAQPSEEGWAGAAEGIEPPLEDNFPQDHTEDLKTQIPKEPIQLDQHGTGDRHGSEVSQKPNTEKDIDPGIIITERSPVDAVDVEKQLETNAEEPASVPPLENAILGIYSFITYLTTALVATLPNDVQPGPDFYGLPWKPVLITAFLGLVSFAIFFWRTVLAVKDRVYQVTEQQISEKLKNIMKENAELVQKLSNYEQKIKESKKHVQETKKQNMILSDEAVKFKDKIKKLEETNEILGDTAKNLRVMLESEREQNAKNQDLILENKKSIEKLKDVISVNASEFSEVQIALNEAKLSEEKVKSECHRVQEENARLKKKKEQLQQEIKDWSKSHAELSEQIKSFEKSQKNLEVALTHKDDNINALTNCITQLNRLDCESESEGQNKGGNDVDEIANGEVGGDRSEKMKTQIKQMMDVSRTQTAISVVEEDLKLLQFKLRASMSTKCNLEEQIKRLEDERSSLQSAKAGLEGECQTLRQKVEILNELYQQKESALQKKLSQEEFERQDREQRLSAADEKALLAAEEVKTYKRRIQEMEDELQKTERSFKNQIATHEKKAHDNWLKARAAERAIAEEKREAANLRHKLLELTQKMAMLQEEPVIVKPRPGRPSTQNPPWRVSGGECSPPPTADPPARPLSATLSRRDMPRSEFGSVDGPPPRPRWSSEASGKPSASADPGPGVAPMMNSGSRSSSPAKGTEDGKQTVSQDPEGPSAPSIPPVAEQSAVVPMAAKGPPPFPGVPLMSSPVGGPLPPPTRYGPPPQLCGPFGPRPLPPPFGPGFRPPLGLREYAPGIPPGKRDLPLDPREFLPGHTPFRPLGSLGPREYFIPGARLPPPPHGPQDYPPPPAARDFLPSGSGDEPAPASQSGSRDCSQALKQSP